MKTLALTLVLVSLPLVGCAGVHSEAKSPSILPLKTLRLYETGVGYFERSGTVGGAGGTSLPVPAGHLDDALKTLVVMSAEGSATKVHALQFGSSMSKGMARALAGLPEGADGTIAYRDLLTSLKGAHVEIATAKGMTAGRLVEVSEETVETPPKAEIEAKVAGKGALKEPKEPQKTLSLLLLSDAGEVRRFAANTVLSVKPTDPAFATRVGAALDALGVRSAQTNRPLELLADSKGPVTFGYIAETPIWRTTYRIVLGNGGKSSALQGWALLHNDTDENWRGVKLELVNGRPDSFLFPLAAPRYARRELIHPEDSLSTVPQLLDTTTDAMWGDDGIGLGEIGTIGHGSGTGSGSGYGYGHGRIGSNASTVGSSDLLSVGNLAALAQAPGVENGALFTYVADSPLALDAHSSALVPFLDQRVDVELVSWVNAETSNARTTARFVNSTGQTLPAGTLAFFEAGGFAGESALDRLKPGERRFIEFGTDLDVEVSSTRIKSSEEPKRVTFTKDVLEEHFLRTTEETLTLENRSGAVRPIYVVRNLDENAKLTGADAVDFDTESKKPVAIFKIEPKKRVERTIVSVEGLSRRNHFPSITAESLTKLSQQTTLPAIDRATLTEAAQKQSDVEASRHEVAQIQEGLQATEKEIERLREDLRAMGEKNGAAGPNPFVARILAAEDKLTLQKKRLETLTKDEKSKVEAVRLSLVKLAP